MQKIGNPVPLFIDARGLLLDGGNIYVGVANADPQTNPITVYSDSALTNPLSQPIQTIGGFAVNGTTPTFMFISQTDYSMRVTDNLGALVAYSPSVYTTTSAFQPASSILDALVANGLPTAFGLSLLKLANAGALTTLLGGLNYLPLSGGTMTGYATHQGAGVEPFWNDAAMTSGKMFLTAAGAGDPTSNPGDIWFEKSS